MSDTRRGPKPAAATRPSGREDADLYELTDYPTHDDAPIDDHDDHDDDNHDDEEDEDSQDEDSEELEGPEVELIRRSRHVGTLGHTTYEPNRMEADWLLQSLFGWFDDGTLVDILYPVRGGKEANVYCCRGGPSTGGALIAAKVYRPRKFRELSNDAVYREGRGLIDRHGHARKARDQRIARAVRSRSRFGKAAGHTSWVMHEYDALCALHDAGGSVPQPVGANDNAVLTSFVGDLDGPAPTMNRLRVPADRAQAALDEVLRNMELLLRLGWVHGDLSPHNLLYWQERPVLIDFPQVADALRNPHAVGLFVRDVQRVCDYFARCGVRVHAEDVADELWDRVFDTDWGVPEGLIAHVR
ncbi:MAG: RIO1 family regulatory kinase/ATPase [Myxococcota bacterium]